MNLDPSGEPRFTLFPPPAPRGYFLPPEDGRVTNVLLQNECPADLAEHVTITDDPVAIQWVLNALARHGPADPGFKPDCTGLALLSG